MSMTRLMNSAMMPVDGEYVRQIITKDDFVWYVQNAQKQGKLVSYIGYPQTAEFIQSITGVPIGVNRELAQLNDGDTMLVCKLRYRVGPSTKGKGIDPDEFEFMLIDYVR